MTTRTPARQLRTQADLAKLAGVSTVTIHKALSNQSGVSDVMRQRIHGLAAKHGYRLNTHAKAMRQGRCGNIALLLSTQPVRSHLPVDLVLGIQDELEKHDCHMSIARLPDQKLTDEGFVPKVLREMFADGLLINYTDHMPRKMLDLIARYRIPSVWINSRQAGDCVYPDDEAAGREATRRLIELGHQRIAFVDFSHDLNVDPQAHFSAAARRDGYAAAMVDARLTPRIAQRSVLYKDRAQAAFDLLQSPDRPTAIVAYSGPVAIAILVAAARLQLEVPRDLAIVSFGDSRIVDPGVIIDTLIIPQAEMGRIGVEMLLLKIQDPTRVLPARAVPFTLAQGQTCQ